MIAERISRPGRMRSAHSPATMRSEKRRFGDRFRELWFAKTQRRPILRGVPTNNVVNDALIEVALVLE